MVNMIIRKTVVSFNEDYPVNDDSNADEFNFIIKGTEAVVIDEHTMSLIPNLSDQEYQKLVGREVEAKWKAEYLVIVNGRVHAVPVKFLDYIRTEPGPLLDDSGNWKFKVMDAGT